MPVFSIDASHSFASVLAKYLHVNFQTLSEVRLLLPSRRAVRSVKEALLLQAKGAPHRLPRMMPLDDLDLLRLLPQSASDPVLPSAATVIAPRERTIVIARALQRYSAEKGELLALPHALRLADASGKLIDDFLRERVPLSVLDSLVPQEIAEHWQHSLRQFTAALDFWKVYCEERSGVDASDYRNRAIAYLNAAWSKKAPSFPVVAAGTTGSIPVVAELLSTIARLPEGSVVLPGYDAALGEQEWRAIGPTHAQWGLTRLLKAMDVEREAVEPLGDAAAHSARARQALLRAVLAPPSATDTWQRLELPWQTALAGVTLLNAADEAEETGIIAMILRHVLAMPGRTAMMVTHDRRLAEQVAARMRAWEVTIDDSAGVALGTLASYRYFQLLAEYARTPGEPLALLALLKHPLLRLGMAAGEVRTLARQLERLTLRGITGWHDRASFEAALWEHPELSEQARDLVLHLHQQMEPLLALMEGKEAPFAAFLAAHGEVAERLALPESPYASPDGRFFSEKYNLLSADAALIGNIAPGDYGETLAALLAKEAYRQPYDTHPRLRILSPLEARMQQADCVILAGLNEESWPPAAAIDPWMSAAMRTRAGLRAHDEEIGLATHDFWMLAQSPEVILTRAAKRKGTPTQPSRYWLRLETVLQAADEEAKASHCQRQARWFEWHQQWCEAEAVPPAVRPAPRPPSAFRPRQANVTEIGTWLSDPYSIYAKKILEVRALEPIGRQPDKRAFGILVHEALQWLSTEYHGALPPEAETLLIDYLSRQNVQLWRGKRTTIFWQLSLKAIARQVVAFLASQPLPRSVQAEAELRHRWRIGEEEVGLHGRADRLEEYESGACTIIDYKTSKVPSKREVETGMQPQLPLLALLLARAEGRLATKLAYWSLKGRDEPLSVQESDNAAGVLSDAAEEGLFTLFAYFLEERHAFVSFTDTLEYSDYRHLARVAEWS